MGFLTFTNSHLFVIQHIYREHFFHLCNFYLLFPNYIFIHFRHTAHAPHPNHLSDKIFSELLLSVSPDPCEAELVFV